MSVNTVYSIEIVPKGTDQVNNAVVAVSKIGSAVDKINSSVNPLTKIIQLLETTNKILMEIGKVGVESFNKLDNINNKVSDGFRKSATNADKLEQNIKKVGDSGEKAGKKMREGFLSKVANFGSAFVGISTAVQGLAGMVGSVFEEGMSRQTAAVNFSTLLRDEGDTKETAAAKGKEFADALRNSTAAALYGTSTVNEAAKGMLSFGISGKETQTVLAQIGDIAAGDAQKFGSLSLAFAQISSAGKLGGQDLMQLINAGFNPLQEISKKTGKSIGELKDDMAKGAISADMVKEAFASATSEGGQFHGMLEDIKNNTLQGKLATLQGSFDDLKAKFFELLLPIVEKLLPIVTDKIFPLIEKMMPLIEGICSVLGILADYISENWEQIQELAVGIGALVGAIMLLTSPVTWTIVAIAALTAGLVWLVKNWEEWHDVVVAICYPLAMVIDIIKSVKKHWDSIVDGFKNGGLLEGIKRLGLAILDGILTPVESLLKMLSKIPVVGKGIGLLADGVTALREKINSAIPDVVKVENASDKPEGNGTQNDLETAVNTDLKGGKGLGGGSSVAKGIEKVATGGTRNTQITITLGNLVGTMAFNGGFEENRDQVESNITDSLLRLLYSAAYAVE